MKIVKRVHQSEMLPPFYGVAWTEFTSPTAVCLPIPLNLIAAALRALWLLLRHGWRPIPINPHAAYRAGQFDAAGKSVCPCCRQFHSHPPTEQ